MPSDLCVMLTQKDTITLLEILGNEEKSLETAAASFQRAFVRSDHFRVAAAMCSILEDNLMLPGHQLAALYIIQDLFKNEPPDVHPFMPFLVGTLAALQGASLDSDHRLRRNILCLMLAQPPTKDLPRRTPAELSASWNSGCDLPPLPNLVSGRSL